MINEENVCVMHFADLHMGVETYGTPDLETGVNTRLSDFKDAAERAFNIARKKGMSLGVFAGDAYSHKHPSQTAQKMFALVVKLFVDAHIPLVIIPGNHDSPKMKGRAHALELFDILGSSDSGTDIIHVYDTWDCHVITDLNGNRLIIQSAPMIYSSDVKEEYDVKDAIETEYARRLEELQVKTADLKNMYGDVPVIFVGHFCVEGADIPEGFDEPIVRLWRMMKTGAAYYALGHLHKHQEILPNIVYSGNLERVSFAEKNDPKGFQFVTIDGETGVLASSEFVEVPVRKMEWRDVTIPDGADPMETLTEALSGDFDGAIVKVNVKTPVDVSAQDVRRLISGASFIAPIRIDRITERSLMVDLGDATSDTLTVTRNYLKFIGADPDRTERVLRIVAEKGVVE